MKLILIVVLLLVAGGGYMYYASRPGPAEEAGAILDTAIDKGQRIIDIVKE